MPVQPYIQPTPPPNTVPPPNGLTLTQFLQTVFVGISGLDGTLVRPAWQVAPPKQPDIEVNWMALGVKRGSPDANSFIGTSPNEGTPVTSQRHETLEIECSIYGPDAIETADLIRDGFQVTQNLQALQYANMGFKEVSPWQRVPDLVNERWVDRVVMSVFIRREIQRVYPILTITSANGTIYVPDITTDYMLAWAVAP